MLFAATGTVTTVALPSIGAQSVEPGGHTVSTGDVTIRVDSASCCGDSAQATGPTSFTLMGVGPGAPPEAAAVGTRVGTMAIWPPCGVAWNTWLPMMKLATKTAAIAPTKPNGAQPRGAGRG
jgi:hypothetical protein